MAISFKNIFKKDESKPEEEKILKQPAKTEQPEEEKTKPEPGHCCGECT